MAGRPVPRAQASKTLKSLPAIFSDTLKGVQLALAVAKEPRMRVVETSSSRDGPYHSAGAFAIGARPLRNPDPEP